MQPSTCSPAGRPLQVKEDIRSHLMHMNDHVSSSSAQQNPVMGLGMKVTDQISSFEQQEKYVYASERGKVSIGRGEYLREKHELTISYVVWKEFCQECLPLRRSLDYQQGKMVCLSRVPISSTLLGLSARGDGVSPPSRVRETVRRLAFWC